MGWASPQTQPGRSQRRAYSQHTAHTARCECVLAVASTTLSKTVVEWVNRERMARAETGNPAYYLTSWAAMMAAFSKAYRSHDDAAVALKAYHTAGCVMLRSEELADYFQRMEALRVRIPRAQVDDSSFLSKVLHELRPRFNYAAREVDKIDRDYAALHDGALVKRDLHTLRSIIVVADLHKPEAAPTAHSAPHGTDQRMAQLEAENAKLKNRQQQRSGSQKRTVHQLSAAEGSADNTTYFYTQAVVDELRAAGKCFNCGDTQHRRWECKNPAVRLGALESPGGADTGTGQASEGSHRGGRGGGRGRGGRGGRGGGRGGRGGRSKRN